MKSGIQVDPDMGGTEQVVLEPGQGDFTGDDAPAYPVIALRYQDFQTVPDQHCGTDERVMATARDDDIIVWHYMTCHCLHV